MKRIYLNEESWGRGFLLDNSGKKMCCLGFASEQLGVPRERLKGVAMPTPLIDGPSDFKKFVKTGRDMPVPTELVERAGAVGDTLKRKLKECSATMFPFLATINDYYHGCTLKRRAEIRDEVLAILRAGFREMGYELAVRRSA